MARIVYITNGMASTLNSSLEFSRRLVRSGHEVTYLSHVNLEGILESHGFPFVPLVERARIEEAWRAGGARDSARFRAESLASTEVEERVTELGAELLLIDAEMHAAILATRRFSLPTLLPIVWFSIFRSPGLPPLDSPLPPGTTAASRARVHVAWARLLAGRAARNLGLESPSRRRAKDRRPLREDATDRRILRELARAKGVDLDATTDWTQWLKPHVYRDIPVLAFNARELDFPHAPSSLLEYVGPMVCRERVESRTSAEEVGEWRAFREARRSAGQRLVYASLGTFWSADRTFLDRLIEVFRRRSDWALVLGLGGKLSRADFGRVPENVLAMDYAPQLEVLEAADAAVTHGGITTINECVTSCVPMLVCSTGHVDQDGCAARVRYHGLGELEDLRTADADSLEKGISRVLEDGGIRTRVEELERVFARYAEEHTAVRAVERALERSSP